MERSLNHCFTTWLNPYNKRWRYKKRENGEKKVVGEIKRELDGSKLTALFPSVAKGSEESWFHLPGWWVAADRTFPVTPAVAVSVRHCGHLPDYPAGYIFIESILFTSHPKVYIKVELGCTYNGRWSKLYPSYSTPPHLLTVWETDSTGFKGAAWPWHEKGSHAMPLSATDFVHALTVMWCPAWKKKKFVPSCDCFF